jgi:hypothetical protein
VNMICENCGSEIPMIRLDVCPGTTYCVNCVDKHAKPFIARMIYGHKTAGDVIIAKGSENVRRLNREYTRAR